MFSLDKSALARGGLKRWWLPGVLCLALVASGFLLPRMMPAQAPEPKPAPEAKAAPQPAHPDTLTYSPPALPEAPYPAAMLGKLALGTVVVLGLCAVTLWVGKRWLRGGPLSAGDGHKLQLLETLAVGRGSSLCLVRAGSQDVLVGVDGSGIKAVLALPGAFESALAEAGQKEEGRPVEETAAAA